LLSFGGCCKAVKFVIGCGAIITAQACTQSCLTFHSIFNALSIISLYFTSLSEFGNLYNFFSYASLNSILSSSAFFSFVQGFSGISFANSFISEKGIQNVLPTSFTAARAAKVPKVQI
jgi:hypothetical protein